MPHLLRPETHPSHPAIIPAHASRLSSMEGA